MSTQTLLEYLVTQLTGRKTKIIFEQPAHKGLLAAATKSGDHAYIRLTPGLDNELEIILHEAAHILHHWQYIKSSQNYQAPAASIPHITQRATLPAWYLQNEKEADSQAAAWLCVANKRAMLPGQTGQILGLLHYLRGEK